MELGGVQRFLAGQTAIVTGGGRGIGRAIALSFARAGATVVLASRTEEQLQGTRSDVDAVGGRAYVVPTDLRVRKDVERLVATTLHETGRIDVVVNNAGVFVWKAFADLSEEEWDRVLSTNLKASYLLIHAALPSLRRAPAGRIVNVSSIHGSVGDANVVAHCAAKFGLIGLTKALAEELRATGITVNALCPGSTDNKRRELAGEPHENALLEALDPHDVAAAALFLVSPAAQGITGSVLDIWGGTRVAIKT